MPFEKYNKYTGVRTINYSCIDNAFEDPHRCGTAPFVPRVDGPIQNSCGSYCSGFDENTGCNKYRPNYPDDYYILNYYKKHGTCVGLEDCKNGIPPNMLHNDSITPIPNANLVENFGLGDVYGMMPSGGLWTIIYILFLILLARAIFAKK